MIVIYLTGVWVFSTTSNIEGKF